MEQHPTQPTIEAFFHDAIDRALRDQGVEASTLTEHYLVQLLASYASHPIDDAPVGVKLLEALDSGPRERRGRLREVGDTSLFVSGFWSESLARKVVDVDYYIDLGGSAYGALARVGEGWARDPYGDVYGTLATKFARFVDVLAIVSQRLMPTGPQDVLRLYDRWLETRSSWAARKLALLGEIGRASCRERG